MATARQSKPQGKPSRARDPVELVAEQPPTDNEQALSPQLPTILPAKFLHTQQIIQDAISASVIHERPLAEVAESCLRVLIEMTQVLSAVVYFEDEQSRELRRLAACGEVSEQSLSEWEQIVARVVRSGLRFSTSGRLAVPLKHRRLVEGVLVVQGLPDEKKQVNQMANLVEAVASRLAAGLDHARLVQKYAQKIERIRNLEDVSRILISALTQEEIMRRSIEAAIRLVDAEAGSLLLVQDPSNHELVFTMAVGPKGEELKDVRLKVGKGVAGLVAQTGVPLIVNDAQHDPRVAREFDLRSGFISRNILAVPVQARNTIIGVLEAVNKCHGQAFSQWDLQEFGSLAHQVAIALDNARLYRDAQGKIARLQKIQEISALLNSSLNQAEIRKRAIEASTILMEADAGSLLLLDEAANELYFEVALGEKGEGVRQVRLKVGEGIAGYVAQTGVPVIVNDVQNDPRFARQVDKKSGFVTRNMVCVPVKARDRMLGVLQAINKTDGGLFGQDHLHDFVTLGHQVGIAIENANLYDEINRLFEGFISASVLAIESRDPTTSGHSGRVATLSCKLAAVVDRMDRGHYAEVRFSTDEMKELRYAAVLHDFGKVGVREDVLLKAQKLFPGELGQLKARFDFIKRTFEAQSLKKKVEVLMSGDRAATAALLAEIDEDLAKKLRETEGILEFLLACNKPTMSKQGGFEGLDKIARYTYESYDGTRPYLTPEEVITLSIPLGSLTADERSEIESHVTHTYRFLSTIPWTKSLKNIPVIAYGHHEKLDATGYPRQVPGVDIPVQTRIMTICDIYDALTASDRPYKTAVSTLNALEILEEEVRQGKIDGELFQL
ncbi:MAG: GAF domain-containing protein, partial [Nitrospiraceae bacterium]